MRTDPAPGGQAADGAEAPARPDRAWLRLVWLTVALLAIAGLAWLDDVTGPDFAFSLFYLVPVVATAWWQGTWSAVTVALAASLGWSLAAFFGESQQALVIALWNSLSRLVIFTGAAVLIARLSRDRGRLRDMARREAELARQDPLTRLPNWRGFEEHVGLAVARCARSGSPLAIGFVDLDNFKRVNDLHGHETGNQVLKQIAAILRETLRGQDVVARVGGDEFVLLLDCPEPDRAARIGERLIDAIVDLGRKHPDAGLGASVGLVIVSAPKAWRERIADLVRLADQAMYRAKAAGKGRVEVIEIEGAPDD